ncbi:MAG: pantothenate kinase [Phycisphaeraceae bacterium]|nr:pantothenate kinase [Phycisphaeraceae bacterium]
MATSMLAISIGNTRCRIGAVVNGKLVESAAALHQNFSAITKLLEDGFYFIRNEERPLALLSSACPPVAERVVDAIDQSLGLPVLRIEQEVPIPIGRQLDPEAIVGEDRLLNAAAAYDVMKQACVVVDAGTAITVDFVDGAGTFHGGAIAPGAALMLDALARGTASLPEVELAAPQEVIGHNTVEAIRCGVFHGLRGMVRELTERYAEVAGNYPIVIATGGDAALLFEGYELVDRIVDDLVLRGMLVAMASVPRG